MDRWLHQTIDWLALGETNPELHRIKDSPSQLPSLGKRHRVIRHSEWKEWARQFNIACSSARELLGNVSFAQRLEGPWADVPKELVPKRVHKAWLDAVISVSHEAMDEAWSEFDSVSRDIMALAWAFMLLDDNRWDSDILDDSRFRRLQDYVVWNVLPGYYLGLKDSGWWDEWGDEFMKKVEYHLWIRDAIEAGEL